MSGLVADTHAVVWYLLESKRLSAIALSAMERAAAAGNPVYVSPISVIEVVYLVEKGRLPTHAFSQLCEAMTDPESVLELASLDLGVARAMTEVPRDLAPDMPDRIIVATALHLKLPLITRDRALKTVGVETIW